LRLIVMAGITKKIVRSGNVSNNILLGCVWPGRSNDCEFVFEHVGNA